MKRKSLAAAFAMAVLLVVFGIVSGRAVKAQDTGPGKYTVQVPGGLAFSEFRGYEAWQVIAISQTDKLVAAILGNPAMIQAYQAGIPGNGKPFPDGARMAKIHWKPEDARDVLHHDGAGEPARRRLHGERQQAVRGQRRMGMGGVQV